ncbi:hypothetical protein C8R44DRAFT_976371 [Mycena epipterygia]|nr:hypothetical protein C8R44DRAFT_976371 [Mycena epipterygia]
MVRSILVTGSNQGLGMHTVHQLASTPDVLVFMGSRKLAAAEEALAKFAAEVHPSSTVVPVQLDITDDTSITAAYTFISDTLKTKDIPGLDVLINNAATGAGSFKEIYLTNVVGTAAVTAAIRPLLANGGAIINISSTLASLTWYTTTPRTAPFYAKYIPYSTSKSALNALTVNWALEEEQAGSGIRVVSICPGFNATNLTGYYGSNSPAAGCKVIVSAALEKDGKSCVWFNKEGPLPW